MMMFAYADPPYIGCADKYPEKAEVNHAELVARLVTEYPDGWALSCHTPSLKYLLNLCPDDVRVMAWVKPFCAFKANVTRPYAWEPVLVRGGRPITRQQPSVRDFVSAGITLKRGLVGAKPDAFCHWLLDMLNVEPGDTLDDLFPGTGIMGRCFDARIAAMRGEFMQVGLAV